MNANPKSRDRKQLIWPVAGLVIGIIAATNPVYEPHITLQAGIAVWCMATLLVIILSARPIGARAGALVAGMVMAVPCFVWSPPLFRGVLMCVMTIPLAAATALVVVPPIAGLRARLAYLFTWCGTRQVERRAPGLDAPALLQLVVATAVLAAAIAIVMAVSNPGHWLPVRWLAGGIMVLACAEMATASLVLVPTAFGLMLPPLMLSPYRSASVGEFWTKRWNIFASQEIFRPLCFAPLARRDVALGLFAAFALSAVGHVLLVFMAMGRWGISFSCGAFFGVQPLLIAVERWLGVRRWRPAAGRAWTLAVLAITSPLFVEPLLQIIENSWGVQESALPPTLAVLGFVIVFSGMVSLGSLAARPGGGETA